MERLADLHIKEGPYKDYPLNPIQHAYPKGKSTETALHDLVYKIYGSLVYWQCRKAIGKTWGLKGGVLDIHFGNKTDVDKCRISLVENDTSDQCKKTAYALGWIAMSGKLSLGS
jgi:hypothetical protein